MTEQPKCKTCRWWLRHHQRAKYGECRADLPKIGNANWPEVEERDFCAHHTPKQEAGE